MAAMAGIDVVATGPFALELFHGVIRARTSAQLRATGDLSEDAAVEIDIEYDSELERYVAVSVSVERNRPGVEITGRLLREVRVQEAIVSVALRDLIEVAYGDHEDDIEILSGERALARVQPMKGRPRPEVLIDAAIVYNIAKLGNWPPLATVAERLGVSQSTATRLIAEVRSADG